MTHIRLSPEEQAEYTALADYLNGFISGAKALAEHLKAQKLQDILAARAAKAPAPNPDSGKE